MQFMTRRYPAILFCDISLNGNKLGVTFDLRHFVAIYILIVPAGDLDMSLGSAAAQR
jgi:hypothetical protein